MADILIRGMDMPKYTTKAEFGIDADGNPLCMVYHEDGTEPDIYDVVPLPEGRGRLIDADVLSAQFKKQIANEDDLMELCKRVGLMSNYFNESKVQIGMITFMRMLNDAKTIVPAEGGGEDGN